jgi:hypothetical protein
MLAPAGEILQKKLRKVSIAQDERLANQLQQGKAEGLRNLLRELIGP